MAAMKDLTTGSLSRHLLTTTSYMLVMMVFQTLYFLVDLYWVGRLGTAPVAAVGVAGNLTFIVLALTQMLGVGTTAVVSHAVGQKDRDRAQLLFNQSQVLAMVTGAAFFVVAMLLREWYARAMSADAETARLAVEYLDWFIPAMALQFAMVAMGAALRGTGNFRPGTVVSMATVVLNMVLAPILIFGWGTGRAFGVSGAAMATFVAIVVGIAWLAMYYVGPQAYLHVAPRTWKPRVDTWKRMLAIGVPTGFEFAMMAVYMMIVYSVSRPFGAAAQAGFGIGQRIIQAGFMPVVALGFAVAPVAGQNYGARLPHRVRATFRDGALMAGGAMFLFTIVCHVIPGPLVGAFTEDLAVTAVGAQYLEIISWNFVASGLIFVASSMFQAMGNTVPSLIASAIRITLVAVPVLWLSRQPGFQLHWVWWVAVGAVVAHLAVSLLFLRREFRVRLGALESTRELPEKDVLGPAA